MTSTSPLLSLQLVVWNEYFYRSLFWLCSAAASFVIRLLMNHLISTWTSCFVTQIVVWKAAAVSGSGGAIKPNNLSPVKGRCVRRCGQMVVCSSDFDDPAQAVNIKGWKASLSPLDQWICPGPHDNSPSTLTLQPSPPVLRHVLFTYLFVPPPTIHFLSQPLKLILI